MPPAQEKVNHHAEQCGGQDITENADILLSLGVGFTALVGQTQTSIANRLSVPR